jgi:hypothetical protein
MVNSPLRSLGDYSDNTSGNGVRPSTRPVTPACRGCESRCPARQVDGHDAEDDLRVQQPSGPIQQGKDLRKLFADNDVGLGGGLHPIDVSVGEPRRQPSGSFHLRQVEITANGEFPCHPDWFRGGPEKTPCQPIHAAAQTLAQYLCLEATLALATIIRHIEITSFAQDFPLAVPFTTVAAAPICARIHARTPSTVNTN